MIHNITCCFCGKVITKDQLVTILLYTADDPDAVQELYSHKECLAIRMIDGIPILFDENQKNDEQ
jgi:uncharacterized protein YbaR (Trm112 family)